MSEGKHTPGPWLYRPDPFDDWGVVRAGQRWICQAKDPEVYRNDDLARHRENKTDPWQANARLIAAAPDLLEALQRLIVNARFDWLGRDDCTAVHAAIAKARGKS